MERIRKVERSNISKIKDKEFSTIIPHGSITFNNHSQGRIVPQISRSPSEKFQYGTRAKYLRTDALKMVRPSSRYLPQEK